jgi:hypothetical protein
VKHAGGPIVKLNVAVSPDRGTFGTQTFPGGLRLFTTKKEIGEPVHSVIPFMVKVYVSPSSTFH